jgi:hypothetical protein
MLFPEPLFKLMILLALALMSVGAVSLIVMLLKDIKSKSLW